MFIAFNNMMGTGNHNKSRFSGVVFKCGQESFSNVVEHKAVYIIQDTVMKYMAHSNQVNEKSLIKGMFVKLLAVQGS